jgi:hypothetical protein
MDFYNRFNDLENFDKHKNVDLLRHKETMAYTLCYCEPSICCKSLDEALQYWEKSDRKNLLWVQKIVSNLQKLKKACKDKEGRKQLFNEWKVYTLQNLRLEKYTSLER